MPKRSLEEMKLKGLMKKARDLGPVLGIQKMAGYEAVFTWGVRRRIRGHELYKENGSDASYQIFPHSEN